MSKCNSSMQLTRAADYAVRVMIHLAEKSVEPDGKVVSLLALASATDAPPSFLSKILQTLSHTGHITSRRGQSGGFLISRRGCTATIREVIEAIDGPVHLNVCLISGRACHRTSVCPAHPIWAKAQQAMLDVLSGTTITEMASQASSRAKHCHAVSLMSPAK